MSIGVDFILKASTAGFTAGLAAAQNGISDLKKSFKAMDLGSVSRMIGFGGIIAGFKSAAEAAQELVDQAYLSGKAVDESTQAAARLGQTYKNVAKAINDGFSWVAKNVQDAAIFVGGLVYGTEAAAEAQRQLNNETLTSEEAIKKVAEAEQRLADIRRNARVKASDEDGKIYWLYIKRLEIEKEIAAAGDDRVKAAEAEGKLIQVNAEIAQQQSKDAERAAKDKVEWEKWFDEAVRKGNQSLDAQADINEKIAKLLLKGTENLTDAEKVQLEILQGKLDKRKAEAEVAMLLLKGVENLTDEEKKRLVALTGITLETKKQVDNLSAQKKLLEDMTKIAGGAAFNEASDEALAERYRRTKQTVIERQLKLQANPGDFTTRLDTGRLQVELENIQREMEARQRLRRDFAIGGESAARRNFKGDPLEFDRVFQQLVTDTRDTKQIQSETLTQLREINQRQKSGIAVVNLNSK